jgi:hypothetical protein
MEQAVGENRAELVKRVMQARVDALIDGFELYGVPIDEALTRFIVEEATTIHRSNLPSALNVATSGMSGGTIAANIVRTVAVPVNSIRCQIEERRARPKMAPEQPQVTNVYHITGDNSRVNVDSTDQSVNVVVVSSEQVFQKIRDTVRSAVPAEQQADILARLQTLEQAQNGPSFGKRYTEFIASAANHMTLIAPFIPALSELLQRTLAGH